MNGQRSSERRRSLRSATPAIFGLAVALVFSAQLAAAGSNCISVSVADRFTLPDGSVHDAARLQLCTERSLSPIAGIHEISVDGVPVGRIISRAGISEGPAQADPIVLFRRASSGLLALVGFSIPDGKHARTFVLNTAPPEAAAPVIAQTMRALEAETQHSYGPVALRHAAD